MARALFLSRSQLLAENLALRQQVCALKFKRPGAPLDDVDRAFWVALRAFWPGWASRLVIVDPDTVAKWAHERFRDHWAKISQRNRRPRRPRIDSEIQRLIRLMAQDGWGEPRIHGELLKLGFEISEITVSRYMPRRPVDPDQLKRWIRSCRRELLAHVVILGERHLVRLKGSYLEYHHKGRPHLRLGKEAPDRRPVSRRPSPAAKVVSLPRVGGLQHRYEWREAA